MDERSVPVLMIIIGVIALIFPLVSTQTVGVITGIIVFLLGFGLLIAGIITLPVTNIFGLLGILFAFICFIFAYNLMFNPAVVSSLISFIVYMMGFMLIVIGALAILTNLSFDSLNRIGIITILCGLLTIVVGVFVHNPVVLGSIIGVGLIVSGLLSLSANKRKSIESKNYIDV